MPLTADERRRLLDTLNAGAFDERGIMRDGARMHVPAFLCDANQTSDQENQLSHPSHVVAFAAQQANRATLNIADGAAREAAYSAKMRELTGRAYSSREGTEARQTMLDDTAEIERQRALMARYQYDFRR